MNKTAHNHKLLLLEFYEDFSIKPVESDENKIKRSEVRYELESSGDFTFNLSD